MKGNMNEAQAASQLLRAPPPLQMGGNAMLMQSIKQGTRNGLDTTLMLAKIIVPIYVFVTFLRHTPVIDLIARAFEPLMGFFHLPGEAALILVMGNVLRARITTT